MFDALPSDIVHEILVTVDSREDLSSIISSCVYIYNVFKARPNSIIRYVVSNEVGMDPAVLPYAWRTLKTLYEVNVLPTVYSSSYYASPILGMDTELTVSARYMNRIVTYLRDNHYMISDMAKCYSVRYKESAKVYDSMESEEARRFYTAAYLYWEYQMFFHSIQDNRYGLSSDTDEDFESRAKDAVDQFLMALPAKELVWMHLFKEFLLDEVERYSQLVPFPWAPLNMATNNTAYPLIDTEHLKHYILTAGPKHFHKWEIYWYPNDASSHNCSSTLCPSDMISSAMRKRGIGSQFLKQPLFKIIQQRGLIIDKCQRCSKPPSISGFFFNITSIPEIALIFHPNVLPGSLSTNRVELKHLNDRIYGAQTFANAGSDDPMVNKFLLLGGNLAHLRVVEEIIKHATIRATQSLAGGTTNRTSTNSDELELSDDEDDDEGSHPITNSTGSGNGGGGIDGSSGTNGTNDEEDGETQKKTKLEDYRWSPLDLLCQHCFQPMLCQFFYEWWLDERQTDRVDRSYQDAFTGDCWWGMDCRTQRYGRHAEKLNHCCPRTK